MKVNTSEWVWLNEHEVCSAANLLEISGLSSEEFEALIEIGVILPIDSGAQEKSFQRRYIVTANTARRLRDDFELDLHGVALAMALIRRIDELQEELSATQALLAHRNPDHGKD
jgi:chaperone modulatory protein CbpM